jgi:hypothetical protein
MSGSKVPFDYIDQGPAGPAGLAGLAGPAGVIRNTKIRTPRYTYVHVRNTTIGTPRYTM